MQSRCDPVGSLAQRAGKDKHWIRAAHLGVKWNWLWTRRGKIHERSSTDSGAGETSGLHQGMLYKCGSDAGSRVKEQGKDTFRQTAFSNALAYRTSDQFAGAGVGCVRFHDHRISRCQGGCGVSASNRKCQRKVARSENHNRPQRTQHGTQIRLGKWLTIRVREVNPCPGPGTLLHDRGKKTKLGAGACRFPL